MRNLDPNPKLCSQCGSPFHQAYSESAASWSGRLVCSRTCAAKSATWQQTPEARAAQSVRASGRRHKPGSPALLKAQQHPRWKGGKGLCPGCGEPLKFYHRARCAACHKKGQKGQGAANWKGGLTPLGHSIRRLPEYVAWRNAVFARDNHTCIHCGRRGGCVLHADHIHPFFLILRGNRVGSIEDAKACSALWDLSNGRTLCIDCHKQTDTYLGRANKLIKASAN